MINDIFRPVRDLLDLRDYVMMSNAVDTEGKLYDDVVERFNALRMLEPSLHGLVQDCLAAGMQSKALDKVIELIGLEGA